METIELDVAGMHCDGCEHSIKRALGRVEGVRSVQASFETGHVVVAVDAPIPRAALEAAIEDAGYDVLPDSGKRLPMA